MDYNQKPLQYSLIVRGQKPQPLVTDPSGWENTLISVKRSTTYYGTIRSFTVPIDFVKEGASIIRAEYYTYGIQADVQLQVSKLNPDTWNYDVVFVGRLDFSNCHDYGYSDGYKFNANVMQADISSLIAAYESTVFEIPFPQTPVLINMPGLVLQEVANFSLGMGSASRDVKFFPNMSITENNINATKPSSRYVIFDKQATPLWSDSGDWYFSPTINTTQTITGSASFSIIGGGVFQIELRDSTGAVLQVIWSVTKPDASEVPYDIVFTTSINTVVGRQYFLYFNYLGGGSFGSGNGYYIERGIFNTTYNTTSPASNVNGMRLFDLYNALIQKIWQLGFPSAPAYPVQSNYLSSTWYQLCVTSGDALRPDQNVASFYNAGDTLTTGVYYTVVNNQFGTGGTVTYNGVTYNIGDTFKAVATATTFSATGFAELSSVSNSAVIKTSFKDFFQSVNSVLNCGFGDLPQTTTSGTTISVATLENKAYFFNSSLPTEKLGDIQKFELSTYIDYVYNTIKGGYPDQTYDVVNGRREINSSVQYYTPITKVQKEFNLQSVYRADIYGEEFLRILLGGNNTTNGDNSVFFIKVRKNPEAGQVYFQPEGAEAYSSVTGVITGAYNLDISPKQNLLRHGDYLAGMLYLINGSIKLASATKSTDLVTVSLSGKRVGERDDVDISTLGAPLFFPFIMNVSSDAPTDVVQNLANFPTGYVDVTKDGNSVQGFIIDAGADPGQNKEQTRSLLLTPKTNIANLIR